MKIYVNSFFFLLINYVNFFKKYYVPNLLLVKLKLILVRIKILLLKIKKGGWSTDYGLVSVRFGMN